MLKRLSNPTLVALLTAIILLLGPWATAIAQDQPPGQVSPAAVESLIQDIEDPVTRERLIQQLRLLAQAEAATAPTSEVHGATTQLLRTISQRLDAFTKSIIQIADSRHEIPNTLSWGFEQISDPQAQQLWIEVLIRLTLVLGLGYLAFYGVRWLLARPHRALVERPPKGLMARTLLLFLILLLDLLTIAAFAIAAYLTLGLVDPREQTRLVALAWINASILVRLVLAFGRLVFAPTAPGLRLPRVSDETAHYVDIWIRRLTLTSIYGYFALQAALLLGLPETAYAALLRLLGLSIVLLVIVLIMQNRITIANDIRGSQQANEARFRLHSVRNRFAQIWYLLAIGYVLVLYGVWALSITGGFLFLLRATALTLIVLTLGHILLGILEESFKCGFHIKRELQASFPSLEMRANRYIPVILASCKGLVYLFIGLAILQAWGLNTFQWLLSEPGRVLSSTVATVVIIVVLTFAVWEIASSLIENYLAEKDRFGRIRVRSARTRTLLTVIRNALFVVLAVVSTLLILAELGVNITPLLAGAGVLGLAVGFGSQKLVQDVITGIFILFEDLVSVGDVVNVGDKAGLVEAVSIRNIRLRDLSGTVHTIPYSAISTISNLTKDFSFYVFDVGIAYREDVDEVAEVLKQIGTELQEDPEFGSLILEPLEVLGVDKLADSAVIIKARIKTLPIKQWSVGRAFNRRMKRRFDELGIEIPFPHQTVYFGVDKKGEAPPARVRLDPDVSVETAPLTALEEDRPYPDHR